MRIAQTIGTVAATPKVWLSIFVIALTAMSSGCGGTDMDRATVSGNVTLNGKPIPLGDILFVPQNGPAWSAKITEGHYSTEGTKGVPVGVIKVQIEAFRQPPGYRGPDPNESFGDETTVPLEQYLPARFNIDSKLSMSIEPGSGSVEKNFDLNTR